MLCRKPVQLTARSLTERHQVEQAGLLKELSFTGQDTKILWDPKFASEQIRQNQAKDPDINPVLKAKLEGCKPSSHEMLMQSPAARHYWILWDNLDLKDGVLFKRFVKSNQTGEFNQPVVPFQMRLQMLTQVHDSLLGGLKL